ncbi:hypothetical protein L6255_04035 [Candidatus Parcubacteria bacterium]|nr:hypothetical protein [Patescibacteria group bacterium]MBU4380663.1 hypothetical protein [Patescibacteria group bacterium]MCG2689580.1 hypothetical protein [Candidatus Parcubacteria bacterium]
MLDLTQLIAPVYAAVSGGTVDTSSWQPENFKGLIEIAIRTLFVVGGVAFVILFLVGAIRYITSGGDVKAVDGAKKNITAAIVGVLILASVYTVAWFLNRTLGAPTFGGVVSWTGSGGGYTSPPGVGAIPSGCAPDNCPFDGRTGNNRCFGGWTFGCDLVSDPKQKSKCFRLSNASGGWDSGSHNKWILNACQVPGETDPAKTLVDFPVGDWGDVCVPHDQGVSSKSCDCGQCL